METSEKNKKWLEKALKTKEDKIKKIEEDLKVKEKNDQMVQKMMVCVILLTLV